MRVIVLDLKRNLNGVTYTKIVFSVFWESLIPRRMSLLGILERQAKKKLQLWITAVVVAAECCVGEEFFLSQILIESNNLWNLCRRAELIEWNLILKRKKQDVNNEINSFWIFHARRYREILAWGCTFYTLYNHIGFIKVTFFNILLINCDSWSIPALETFKLKVFWRFRDKWYL